MACNSHLFADRVRIGNGLDQQDALVLSVFFTF
jgi:hypothetical protein